MFLGSLWIFGEGLVWAVQGYKYQENAREVSPCVQVKAPRTCAEKATGSLGVTLRAKPRDTAVSVHPVVRVGLAFQAGDFSGLGARIFGQDVPVVLCVSDDFEDYFCFCHA